MIISFRTSYQSLGDKSLKVVDIDPRRVSGSVEYQVSAVCSKVEPSSLANVEHIFRVQLWLLLMDGVDMMQVERLEVVCPH